MTPEQREGLSRAPTAPLVGAPATGTHGSTAAAPVPEPGQRGLLKRLLRYGFVVAAVVAVAVLLWRERDQTLRALRSVSPEMLLLSLLFGGLAAFLPGVMWRDLLSKEGEVVPARGVLRAFFLSQLGKYLPGGVWALVAQVDMAKDLRVPRVRAATATLLVTAMSVISGIVVAGVVLPFSMSGLVSRYYWVFLVVPVLLALLHPRAVAWWSGAIFRLLRRPATPVRPSWGATLRVSALSLLVWACYGVHFGALVHGLGHAGASTWLLSTGVFALAWVAGFLFVIAPAGAGIREAVLVLGLSAQLPAGTVLALAVLSRVLLVVVDVLLALVLLGVDRVTRRLSLPAARRS